MGSTSIVTDRHQATLLILLTSASFPCNPFNHGRRRTGPPWLSSAILLMLARGFTHFLLLQHSALTLRARCVEYQHRYGRTETHRDRESVRPSGQALRNHYRGGHVLVGV